MRIVVSEFMSLDGVIQAPGGPDEDTDGGFAHGGWSVPLFDPEAMGPAIGEAYETTDALLFGRRTWRVMADHWPGRAGDPFADQMNAIPKYVASRTLTEADLDWNGSQLLTGDDVLDQVRALKDQDGRDLHVVGSANFARQLVDADLVDELNLMIEPVVLGGGKRLFSDDGIARPLQLVDLRQASTGVLICRYQPTGSGLPTGSSDEFYDAEPD